MNVEEFRAAQVAASKRRPKYSNSRTVINGVAFDSRLEASRWQQLLMQQQAGLISDLKRQVSFTLAPSVKFTGARAATPALRYFADATYIENGALVVEDCKGFRTDVFKLKRHLMLAVHGIQIREVRAR